MPVFVRNQFLQGHLWVLFWLSLGCVGCAEHIIRPDSHLASELRNQPYSDRDWAVVLRDNVRYGLVDYQTLRLNREPLDRYYALVNQAGPTRQSEQFPSRVHFVAYYINVYNALVLEAVLSRDQVTTMYDLKLPRLEHEYRFLVDGAECNLAAIEEKIMKHSGGDVRALLATSRAALGTPRLMNEPIRAETLERQLATAAAEALDLPEILRIDHTARSILVWQLILRREDELVENWKIQRRVRSAYLFNVLLELSSPPRRRALQSAVMAGRVQSAFCAVRPPGHHAERDRAVGFCFLNNIAIAAEYLRRQHGLQRVAILDWDVHHGNGTQHHFEADPSVLFVSIHQHPLTLYPGTGFEWETGRGPGTGFTLNCPMMPGSGDQDYHRAFERQILPRIADFKPEFILVSAGFDAHVDDPLANIELTTAAFEWMTRQTCRLAGQFAQHRVVSVLEGGYHIDALADCILAHLEAMG